MYNHGLGVALPVTGLGISLASGLGWVYAFLIVFVIIGAIFAARRILPKRHTS